MLRSPQCQEVGSPPDGKKKRQRCAALDAQFERALAGVDSFDVSVLDAVRECAVKSGCMHRLPVRRRLSVRAGVAGGSARSLCGVVVAESARPKWRSRFSALRRYKHTSDAFRKSVLRHICTAPAVGINDVPMTTCLRRTRKALNAAFVASLPDARVAGRSSHARVLRLCEVAVRRVCVSPCVFVVRVVHCVTPRLSAAACAPE